MMLIETSAPLRQEGAVPGKIAQQVRWILMRLAAQDLFRQKQRM
jgi:hypothetical protein